MFKTLDGRYGYFIPGGPMQSPIFVEVDPDKPPPTAVQPARTQDWIDYMPDCGTCFECNERVQPYPEDPDLCPFCGTEVYRP